MYTDEQEQTPRGRKKAESITVNELLSAIGETEYPQYILDAITTVQEWMHDMTEKPADPVDEQDIFAPLFASMFEDEDAGIAGLFDRLKSIEDFADIVPNTKVPDGRPDAVIVSISPPDFESGIRTAIDYAAVFNRNKCRRVWIISDMFAFDEVVRFVPHVDALAEQNIMLRYILVTPWGWVEMPLSGSMASRHKFLWHSRQERSTEKAEKTKPRKRREN